MNDSHHLAFQNNLAAEHYIDRSRICFTIKDTEEWNNGNEDFVFREYGQRKEGSKMDYSGRDCLPVDLPWNSSY